MSASVLALALAAPAAGVPIPPGPYDGSVPSFEGAAAEPRPVDSRPLPQNPHLAANGSSSMHDDAYASDAHAGGGPLGRDLQVSSATYGVEECATMAFDRHGRIVALCGGAEGSRLGGGTLELRDAAVVRPGRDRHARRRCGQGQDKDAGQCAHLPER